MNYTPTGWKVLDNNYFKCPDFDGYFECPKCKNQKYIVEGQFAISKSELYHAFFNNLHFGKEHICSWTIDKLNKKQDQICKCGKKYFYLGMYLGKFELIYPDGKIHSCNKRSVNIKDTPHDGAKYLSDCLYQKLDKFGIQKYLDFMNKDIELF
jgi:hypothetical protein